jgi:hypothetical protein
MRAWILTASILGVLGAGALSPATAHAGGVSHFSISIGSGYPSYYYNYHKYRDHDHKPRHHYSRKAYHHRKHDLRTHHAPRRSAFEMTYYGGKYGHGPGHKFHHRGKQGHGHGHSSRRHHGLRD